MHWKRVIIPVAISIKIRVFGLHIYYSQRITKYSLAVTQATVRTLKKSAIGLRRLTWYCLIADNTTIAGGIFI